VDTVNVAAHAVVGGARDWPATVRAIAVLGAATAIAWHSPDVSKYALAVVSLVASPALARAILAPRLAAMLNTSPNSGAFPAVHRDPSE